MTGTMRMEYKIGINSPLVRREAKTLMVEGDRCANTIVIEVTDGLEPANLNGCTACAYMIRSDGQKPFVHGTVEGNVVTVCLNEGFYATPGRYELFVRLTSTDGTKRTLLWLNGWINDEGQGDVIDTENVVPDLEDLLAQIDAMEKATKAANQAAQTANAAATQAVEIATNKGNEALQNVDAAVARQDEVIGQLSEEIDSFDYELAVQRTIRYGNVVESPDNQYKITSLIDVSKYRQIIVTASANYYNNVYAFYDENEAYIKDGSLVAQTGTYLKMAVVDVPANAKYVRVGIMDSLSNPETPTNKNDTAMFVGYRTAESKVTESKLHGKTWAVFGDSLTDCTNALAFRRYYRVLSDTTTNIANYAVSGSGYYQNNGGTPDNILARVQALTGDEGFDVISVFAGINDSGGDFGGIGKGQLGDSGDTMYGRVYQVFSTLQNKYPNAFIFGITPTVTSYRHSAHNEIDQIADIVKDVCRWLKIPIADVNANAPLKPWIEANQQKYYMDGDGVHPNAEGHKLIAKAIKPVFQSM